MSTHCTKAWLQCRHHLYFYVYLSSPYLGSLQFVLISREVGPKKSIIEKVSCKGYCLGTRAGH